MHRITVGDLIADLDQDQEVERLIAQIEDSKTQLRRLLVERETQIRIVARLASVGGWLVLGQPLRFRPSLEWLRIHELEGIREMPIKGFLRIFPASQQPNLMRALRACARDGQPFDLIVESKTASGRRIHVRMIAEAQLDCDQKVVKVIGACQDVTSMIQRELELAAHRDHLEELVQERTWDVQTFSYALAHDLRGPITAMAGFAGAIQQLDEPRSQSMTRYISRIVANGARAESLIEGILQLIRTAAGPMHRETVDVTTLAEAALEQLATADPERDVAVRIAPSMTAMADSRLLMSVLDNLLSNAWKFTSKTHLATITVGQSDNGIFFVEDNGAGFDMAHADHLFHPLKRLHAQGEFSGNGVGLAVAAKIIRRHGGWIRADARPGHGARFEFTLGEQSSDTPG